MEKEVKFGDIVVVVVKKWYFTILVPLLIMLTFAYVYDKHQKNNSVYTVNSAVVVAMKASGDDKLTNDQQRLIKQNFNETMIETVSDLLVSGSVLDTAIRRVDGINAYTDSQLNYRVIPNLRQNMYVNNREGSMILDITLSDKSSGRSQKLINELMKAAQEKETEIWGTDNIKILTKAVKPTHKTTNMESLIKYSGLVFVILFVTISGVVSWRNSANS